MGRPRLKTCKLGHPRNFNNARYREGKGWACNECNRILGRLKYRRDPEYREHKLQQAREYRAREREQDAQASVREMRAVLQTQEEWYSHH